jgi:hypothetical protein
MLRINEESPWVQIESCSSESLAWEHVDEAGLEDDEALRAYEIAATAEEDGQQPDWGKNAPSEGLRP